MIVGINKGHTLAGPNSGAIGCGYKEQDLTREVGAVVERIFKQEGHTTVDCTVDQASDNSVALKSIVTKANKQKLDLFLSIHFNACVNDETGDGKTTGVEAYVYNSTSSAKPHAERICKNISSLGLKNRGAKVNAKLYVIKHTNAPAVLVECCFIDDRDDMKVYDAEKFGKAIAEAILNKKVSNPSQSTTPAKPSYNSKTTFYRVVCGSYTDESNANRVMKELKEKGYSAFIDIFEKEN